jgi:Sap, sulfolipid-1-addressing protein
MSTQPLRNALAFLLGVAAVYLALGFLTLLIFGRTLSDMLQGTIILDAILVLMASGLLVIAGRALFVAPRRGGSRLRWMQRLTTISPGQAFLAGLIIACSLQAVVIFLSGVIIISESGISLALRVIALLVLITLTLLLQIIPVALYSSNARRVRGHLLALVEWLNQHDRAITTGFSLILGTIFLIVGLRGLIPVILTRS